MPCLLKRATPKSPGIITFTHNEALRGLPQNSQRVRRFLRESTASGLWLFGVHVQGFVDYLKEWPEADWQSFVLWPNAEDPVFRKIPKERWLDLSCINFLPEIPAPEPAPRRDIDLVIIAHATTLKRIYELLQIVRKALKLKPDLRAVFIVPDQRELALGPGTYSRQEIDRRFFELPQQIFSAAELKRLSFIASSTEAFGKFPLAAEEVWDLLRRAKFLLSFSMYEGTPRVFGEAFLAGTPCAINRSAAFGLRKAHNEQNTLWLGEDLDQVAEDIVAALQDYQRFSIDLDTIRSIYSENQNLPRLRAFLEAQIRRSGREVEGEWYLNDLHLRLPCHGQKINHQFMYNEALFFDWLEKVERFSPYDEDATLGLPPLNDEPGWGKRLEAAYDASRGSVIQLVRGILKRRAT